MCSMFFCGSALNSKGFTSQVSQGQLPSADHITYPGVFNQIDFEVGPKTDKVADLHIGFCRASNPSSISNKQVNEFIALFLKGKDDGQPRDERILNSVIILDVSGSMNGGLTFSNKQKNRLQLSKQAIKMFISKLRDDDSLGIVSFNTEAKTILKGMKKSQLDLQTVFTLIDNISANGGTTLNSGFTLGLKIMDQISSGCQSPCQNRLILLTDVGDNSVSKTNEFIKKVSDTNIHTTIIGISDDFRSQICQQLITIKGFNYFCATQTDDLKKYLFQNFDWTFFPSCYDIELSINSDNIKSFQVFGTSDSKNISQYNSFGKKGITQFIITKTTSCFPSQIKIFDGIVKTVGGLFLLKLPHQNILDSFQGTVKLTYKSKDLKIYEQLYPLHFQFPKNEQFFSQKCLQQAINAFYFVYEIKCLIDRMRNQQSKFEQNRQEYINSLISLKEIAPKTKQKQVDDVVSLVKKYKNQSKQI